MGAVQSEMGARGIELAVIGPSANLRYVLGYEAMSVDRLTVLLVSPTSAVMVLPDFDATEFEAATGFGSVLPWADRQGPRRAVEQAFEQLGGVAANSTVAIDDELPFQFYAQLRDHLPSDKTALASGLMLSEPLRLVKTAAEQEQIARTGALISAGIDLAQSQAAAGMTELALKRMIEEAMWEGGAESVDYVLVQAGTNSASPHHNADQTAFRAGEPVLIDIAVKVDGYFADITQQVFLGQPSSEYRAAYDVVHAAQEAGVRAARPSATVADVAEAATAVIVQAGYGEWNGPRTGHGIGMDVHEPPSVVEGNETELVPGMVITIEPGVYIPNSFGIRIEDTVVVTDDEPKRLTRGSRPLCAA